MRAAFTLVEVIVALVIFELGMLALAGVAAVAARDLASANRTARANALARNRVELMRSGACAAATSGTARTGGAMEHWRVQADQTTRIISDSVAFALPNGRMGNVVSRAWVLCGL